VGIAVVSYNFHWLEVLAVLSSQQPDALGDTSSQDLKISRLTWWRLQGRGDNASLHCLHGDEYGIWSNNDGFRIMVADVVGDQLRRIIRS